MKKLIIISLLIPIIGFGQDYSKKKELSFEEYKKKETQKYSDFEKKVISDLNNFISLEEEWNLITISTKGNIKDLIINNNNNIEKNTKQEIIVLKEPKIILKETKPDYILKENTDYSISNLDNFSNPLKNNNFRISSKFGNRTHPVYKTKKFHSGIDLAAAVNTPIHSVKSGVVIQSGFVRGYGNYVIVKHSDGYKSAYAHLNSIKVKKNQKVSNGDIIGTLGKTGTATGYHLHFELIKSNKKIDPLFIFNS
tara:strand:+ start:1480 stop:2235 length:756 start_codon:yes stop_codon:yes gene_type:complete